MRRLDGFLIISVFLLSALPYIATATEWHIETVDGAGQVGEYSSLALDSNGYPHISYFDRTNWDLKYAYWDGVEWQIQTVDSENAIGSHTSIALDNNDYPHISYGDDSRSALKYAYWDGVEWQMQIVDSVGSNCTSLALDSNGYPYISYLDVVNYDLKYAYWDGIEWQIETVDSEGYVGYYTSLALDNDDYPHISYIDVTNLALKYAYWDGARWQIQTVDNSRGEHTSLVLDANGNPHISYHYLGNENDALKYAYWDGAVWQIQTVDSEGVGNFTSLALDSNGYPHISYYDNRNQNLKYAYWNGSGWQIQTVDSEGDVGCYTSLALDSNDYPHISYGDYHPNYDLKYTTLVPPDTTPPTPNTIASVVAASITQIDITSTEAQDDTPPVFYRLDGQYYDGASWVDSGGGVSDYDYSTTRPNPWSDTNLFENGWYRYRQRIKDSVEPPNESAWSDWVEKATLLNPPQDAEISFANVAATGMDVTIATPPKPSGAGSTGAYFDLITGEGQGSGANDRDFADDYTAEYTNLIPNTQYGWRVKYRNRGGVETAYNPTEQKRYTLANTPSAPTVSNPTETTLDVQINPNGNPDYTLFAIYNVTGSYYINATGGSNGATEVWQTKSDWGIVTVVNLTPETTYEFRCKAKNGDGIETPLGVTGSGTTTAPSVPVIDSFSPTSGVVGTQVTISGSNFGEEQGDSTVTFNGVDVGAADNWSDTEIKVKVPVGATTGPVVVTVNEQASNSDKIFTVIQPPIISSINPTGGPIGTQVTITGSNFEAEQGASTVTFFDNVNAEMADSWMDTEIKIKVPQGTSTGAVFVTVNGVESNKDKIFTVTADVTVKLEADEKKIPLGATANIDIMVENAPGVSGFEFKILYDSNVVSIKNSTDVQLGPFLESTGRDVFLVGPDIRENLTPAEVTFGAASLLGTNPLPTGDGILASIVFTAVGVGMTTLDLTNVKLLDADANKIPVNEGDGKITVEQVLYGDVSGNGDVSAFDASLILRAVVGLISLPDPRYPQFDIQTADVSGNGQITGYDAALVLQQSVGLISCFPVDPSCQAAPASLASSYSLRIPTLAAKFGERVTVPLIINSDAHFPRRGLSQESGRDVPLSGQFVLEYDVENLNFLRVFSNQLHRDAVIVYRRNGEQLHIAFANPQSFSSLPNNDADKGIAILFFEFELRNKVYSQPMIPLMLSQASLNEGVIPTLYSGGIEMLPIKTAVLPNYPNPFNPETWIPFKLASDSHVEINIYNVKAILLRKYRQVSKNLNGSCRNPKEFFILGFDFLQVRIVCGL